MINDPETNVLRAAYSKWISLALPMLNERKSRIRAFKTYPWAAFTRTPWTPFQKELRECRIALVTTAGLYMRGGQKPFTLDDPGGDPGGDSSFRELPRDVIPSRLSIAHGHYPEQPALSDMNVVFPLWRFLELKEEGIVGDMAPTSYSIGHTLKAYELMEKTAPSIAQKMIEERVDIAFLTPI